MAYNPKQRLVPARFLTPTGWMRGTFHLPPKSYFLDYLNLRHNFIRITDVTADEQQLPFLALQKSALALVYGPEEGVEMARPITSMKIQEITCLMDQGYIKGFIDILHMTRMSDFFKNQDSFVLIRDSTVFLKNLAGGPGDSERFDNILVNSQHIIGVTETPQQSG